jgi:hypothetical protein
MSGDPLYYKYASAGDALLRYGAPLDDGSPLLRFDVRCAVMAALSETYTGEWNSAPVILERW